MTVASLVPASGEVISLSEERASARRRSFQLRAREVGEQSFARAGAYDVDGCAGRPARGRRWKSVTVKA